MLFNAALSVSRQLAMRYWLVLLQLLVLLSTQSFAQQGHQDERHFLFYHAKQVPSRMNGGAVQPHWMADDESFWYIEESPEGPVIWRVDPRANVKERQFQDTNRLRAGLSRLGLTLPEKGLPIRDFHFVNEREKEVYFSVEGRAFILDLDSYRLDETKPEVSSVPAWNETASPDGRWFVRMESHNVILRSAEKGDELKLTRDGTPEYSWGLTAHSEKTAVWSSNSSKLAVRKTDFKGVPKLPIVDFLQTIEQVTWEFYSRPGEANPQTELFILDIDTQNKIAVDIGQGPDQNVVPLTWWPGGNEFLFLRLAQFGSIAQLMAAQPTDGSTRVVLDDTNVRLLEPSHASKVLRPLEDGKRFIWQSERDGWNHLYLYDLDGTLHCQLTSGTFPVHELVTVDEKAGWVYFTARNDPKRPYDIHLCRVDLQGSKFACLTEAHGQHDVSFCPSKAFFLDTHSAVDRPPRVDVRSRDGKLLQTLSAADETAIRRLGWRPPEEIVVKAADGDTDLWGTLYKPYDFDPSEEYPVINVVYGFPGMTFAPHSFKRLSHDFQGLANFGFIVWVLDGRGTAGRGLEFRRAILGNVGRMEVEDYTAGLKQVASSRRYIDMKRVGVYGVSYGGYTALRCLLTRPEVFKVCVAVSPITDMAGHAWNEGLLGPIEENRDAYRAASNLPLAKNLEGKLFLIHGSSDRAVPFSHTMKMADALIQANKPFDLLVLPGQDHVGGYQYWWNAVRRYFDEHLEP